MKKQIFKLTSILLAMVMVFSLFTIIPISAKETTVDLATAADNLETAWQNLDYAGYRHSQWVNFIGAWLNDTSRAEYVATSAPDYAPSIHNYTFTVTSTSKQFLWGSQTTGSIGMETFKMFDELKANIEDMYFYYRSTGDVTVQVVSVLNNGVDTDSTNGNEWVSCNFPSTQVIESTNGDWEKFSWNEFLTNKVGGHTVQSAFHSGGYADWAYFLRLGFVFVADSDVEFSVGDLFAEVKDFDKNLVGCEDWSDADWYDKAVLVDENVLKADYRDAADSATWLAFTSALEAVRACEDEYVEANLRATAEKMITSVSSYAYPIQQGRTNYSSLMTATNSTVSEFGSYYRELTLPNYGKAIDSAIGVDSIWLQTKYVPSGTDNLRFGDMGTNPYITVEIISTGTASVAHLGFFGRFNGISPTDLTSSYTKEVVAGNTYQIYLDDILTGFGSQLDNWETTTKSTGSISGGLFAMGATDAEVTLKVGSVVSTTNYEIISDKTGAEFAAEMAALDISSFGNTAPFLAALEAVLEFYPDLGSAIAIDELRAAASKMLTSITPVAYPGIDYSTGSLANISDYVSYTVDNAEYLTFGPAKTHAISVGASAGRNSGVWLTGVMNGRATWTGDASTEDTYVSIYVKSIANPSATPAIKIYTRTMPVGSNMKEEPGIYYLNGIEAGKTYKILLKDLLAVNNYTVADLAGSSLDMHFFSIQANGSDMELEVGSLITTNYYSPSDKVGADFIGEMATLDISAYSNTEEFEEKLAYVLDNYYPEIKDLIEVGNTVRDLKNTWKNLTYIPQQMNTAPLRAYSTGGSKTTKAVFAAGDDASKGYLTSADGVGTAYLFPVDDYKDSNGDSTPYEWFVWGNVGSNIFLKEDMVSFGFWYKSESQITSIRVIAEGSNLTTNGGVLPATGDEWSFITIEELAGTTVWNSFLSNANLTNITDFRLMFTNTTARSTEIYFGDLVVYGKDEQIKGIDTWSNVELAVNADKANLDFYEDGAELKAQFATLTAKLKEIYAANFAAQDVIDAAANLGDLGLKPAYTTSPWISDEIQGGEVNYLYGASDNGEYTAFVKTDEIGSKSSSASTGSVVFEAKEPIALTEIDDIYFSYKIEKWAGPETGARIWFYDERYAYFKEDEEGNVIVDEDGKKTVVKGYWACNMPYHGPSKNLYFKVSGDTVGWATTSIAAIFGSDWKTQYVQYLNGVKDAPNNSTDADGNPYAGTITMENTYITKLSLGFNGADIVGDKADVTLGSMYVKYSNNPFVISADIDKPETVLTEALALDVTNCKKADADAFKKAVAALAKKLGREGDVSKENCVAGNKTANLVDLSLLSRYVDAVKAEKVNEFLEDNYIDLKAANIVGEGDVVDEDDLIALRKRLLGVPEN